MSLLSFDRQQLARALARGKAAVERAGAIDVLGNVLVSVSQGSARLTFTDLDLWLSTTVPVEADAITAFTLNADRVARAASTMDGATLHIRVENGKATLSCARSRMTLPVIGADQFPVVVPTPKAEEVATVIAADLGRVIGTVAYARSDGIVSKYISAVRLECSSRGTLDAYATDGAKAALAKCDCDDDLQPINLPGKAAALLVSLCDDAPEATVEIEGDQRIATFQIGDWRLTAKQVDGAYLPIEALGKAIAGATSEPILFDPKEMQRAVARLAIIADKYSRGVKLSIAGDELTLSLTAAGVGEATETLIVGYDGQPDTLGYSLDLLRDALRSVEGDEAEMRFNAEPRFAVIAGRSDGAGRHMIGPYKI